MSAGTELYLPVEVAGGLFSVGDTHACQGDGEVCGTRGGAPLPATTAGGVRLENRFRYLVVSVEEPI